MSHLIIRNENGRRHKEDVGAAELTMSFHPDVVVDGREETPLTVLQFEDVVDLAEFKDEATWDAYDHFNSERRP